MAELSTLIHRSTLGGGVGDIKVKQYFASILKQEKGSGSASAPPRITSAGRADSARDLRLSG